MVSKPRLGYMGHLLPVARVDPYRRNMHSGSATNNQAEYDGVNGLLAIVLQLGIFHLDVFLDSQLLVSQLNNY